MLHKSKGAYSACLVLFAVIPIQALAEQPDLEAFFRNCPSLTNFEMVEREQRAVSSGRTRLNSTARAAIADISAEWRTAGDTDVRRLAYILATARRESAVSWLPIREAPRCGNDEGCRERAIGRLLAERAERRGRPVRSNYALPDDNGRRYYGRGYIQLTGRSNYARVDRLLGTGTQFVDNPDLVMEPAMARRILVRGMLEGWFGNGRPLRHYFVGDRADWNNARDNVNPGSPNKPVTAASAREIHSCLTAP